MHPHDNQILDDDVLQQIKEQNLIFSETKYEERKKRKQRKREMKQEIKSQEEGDESNLNKIK